MCPVYGRIAAGVPNWAEQCMEGRLPLDPDMMNIHNPEECFFLRVSGESMNKIVKNVAVQMVSVHHVYLSICCIRINVIHVQM